MRIIITRGLPGSLKTTWSKKYIKAHKGYVRVCKDDIRLMLYNNIEDHLKDDLVNEIFHRTILLALDNGKSVVVDGMYIPNKHIDVIRDLVKGKATVTLKNFHTQIEECLQRVNGKRKQFLLDVYNKYFV